MILGLALYLAFFSSGLGPGNWVVVSEVFSLSIRAKAMSVAVLPNRITATIMASTFLSIAHAITWPGFFLLLAGICLVSFVFVYVYLPETAGRSLEGTSSSLWYSLLVGSYLDSRHSFLYCQKCPFTLPRLPAIDRFSISKSDYSRGGKKLNWRRHRRRHGVSFLEQQTRAGLCPVRPVRRRTSKVWPEQRNGLSLFSLA
jgi:hypothetical protein